MGSLDVVIITFLLVGVFLLMNDCSIAGGLGFVIAAGCIELLSLI